MNSGNVLILLAAYNGQCNLTEQINSILNQKGVSLKLQISLDLSDDQSEVICGYFEQSFINVGLLPYGERFGGAGKNFYRLLKDTDITGCDYIAFSDQDDIWPDNKLSRAIEKLKHHDCYSSNVTAFWDDGREMLVDKAQPQREWDYFFEAAGPGCTYVFKREVAMRFKSWLLGRYEKVGNDVELHDWLLYAFARSQGYSWFIDPEPMMLYRQHAYNQVGTNNGFVAAKKRLKLIKGRWYRNQIKKIIEHLALQNTAISKRGLDAGYMGNLYLLYHVGKLRRRLRDRLALALVLLLNVF